jgi:hypothetical protein
MLPYPRTQNRATKKKREIEHTSSTKTLPGSGGKASKPDALLRTPSCLPFLGICTKTKSEKRKKLQSYVQWRGEPTGNRMLEHGPRGEQEEEGTEGKGDGEVAVRKLHDSMERERRREESGGNGRVFQFCFCLSVYIYEFYVIFSDCKMLQRWM